MDDRSTTLFHTRPMWRVRAPHSPGGNAVRGRRLLLLVSSLASSAALGPFAGDAVAAPYCDSSRPALEFQAGWTAHFILTCSSANHATFSATITQQPAKATITGGGA